MISITATRDRLIRDARGGVDLIQRAQIADPDLAQQLTGKSLLSTRSTPVVAVSAILMWLSSRYLLGLDQTTADLLAFVVLTAVSYVMRSITKVPVTTLVSKPVVPLGLPGVPGGVGEGAPQVSPR